MYLNSLGPSLPAVLEVWARSFWVQLGLQVRIFFVFPPSMAVEGLLRVWSCTE